VEESDFAAVALAKKLDLDWSGAAADDADGLCLLWWVYC
jgi:hypothetical protein